MSHRRSVMLFIFLSDIGIMNRLKLIISACFGVASLICAIVASVTTYWFELRCVETQGNNSMPGFAREDPYPFTFHLGLFVTCYNNDIPPTAIRNTITDGNCTMDYNFSSNRIEDFSRSSIVCIMLADSFLLLACVVCLIAILVKHRGAAFLSGLLFLCSIICAVVGNLTFTARVILQMENMTLPSNVADRFGWSYFVSWSALCLQIIAGVCTITCSCNRADANHDGADDEEQTKNKL